MKSLKMDPASIKRRKNTIPNAQRQRMLMREALLKEAIETSKQDRQDHRSLRRRRYGAHVQGLLISPIFARRLRASNPSAGALWAGYLLEAVKAKPCDQQPHFATVLQATWDFSGTADPLGPEELRQRLRQIQREVRNRMKKLGFLLQLDVALHRVKGAKNRRVCVHFHGVAWGGTDEVKAAMNRFHEGFGGAPGGVAMPITVEEDWPRILTYIAKDTRCGAVHVLRQRPEGGKPRRFGHKDPLTRRQRLFLFRLFGDITKPELCIGSGHGAEILRYARKLAADAGWRRSPAWRKGA